MNVRQSGINTGENASMHGTKDKPYDARVKRALE